MPVNAKRAAVTHRDHETAAMLIAMISGEVQEP